MEGKISFSTGFFGKAYNAISEKVTYNNPNYSIYNNKGKSVKLEPLVSRVGSRPILLNKNMEQIEILENATNVILEQEVKGMDELTFNINLSDKHRGKIVNESYVQMFNTIYVIRSIIDDKSSRNTEVFCEATWYDIMYAEPFDLNGLNWVSTSVASIMIDMLKGTGWSLGTCKINKKVTVHLDSVEVNRLSALRTLENICNGELVFNTLTKTVDMIEDGGSFTGASIMYDKNADNIKAEYDTRELVTKIVPYGKDGMTIESANNGKPYLENYSYTNTVRYQTISDERYTNPYELKEACEIALAELSKPRVSYTTTMSEIMTDTSGHEQFFIGGIVRVYDKELNLDTLTRIMKWKLNVSEPWNSDVTLESKAKSLSELLTGVESINSSFSVDSSSGSVTDMTPFNYLMNSRADDGFAYWQGGNGWEIDTVNGASGNVSFKANGSLGTTKTLTQVITPATRNAYALSFKGATENLVKGSNCRIGIEVVVTFEDGSTETQFVSLV